jgi:DNA-binding NarL/FixJ family response regulator
MLETMTRDAGRIGVLVVDDEPQHRALCRLALEPFDGIDVIGEAHNGRRGIELADELQPDVVVLDLRMPTMDGLTALPEILRAAPFARVVVWSASGDSPMHRLLAMEAGAVACVRKGASLEQLVDVLLEQADRAIIA